MRAIDLYAGVGGWSQGLRLAGVDVVASFEWWQPAVDTHNKNHGGNASPVDIRKLNYQTVHERIDLLVGSPPCTEFSYSNRGGNGDLEEGLKDLVRFFEAVEHFQPRYWVMENVPRVAEVLRHGLVTRGHPLNRFEDLKPEIHVLDMSTFGVPQARKRCIAGNIPFELLLSYAAKVRQHTLGDVIQALAADDVVDPVWAARLSRDQLTEMETEPALNGEELRMNREAKLYHPVYNNMSFPDDLDVPARTVTATCTRVSRESIVIADPRSEGSYRRLTVRERACLQGFPITYQFYGSSFSEKAKMVGNAIPPPFTYLVANAALGVPTDALKTFEQAGAQLALPQAVPPVTEPDGEGRSYRPKRRFRAALPHLRFKSGMRFDLSNEFDGDAVSWCVRFYFGPSKDVRPIDLDGDLFRELQPLLGRFFRECGSDFEHASKVVALASAEGLQEVWRHRQNGVGPYEIVDLLGDLADVIFERLNVAELDQVQVEQFVLMVAAEGSDDVVPGAHKLRRNARRILTGFLVGSWFNAQFGAQPERVAA